MGNGIRKAGLCLLAALLLAVACGVPAGALQEKARTVRVAYPVQPGLSGYDQYGNRTGYTYEYLEEIAQYTGWEYEFVESPGSLNDSLVDLMDQLDRGEVDLMGAMAYTDDMGERYDYTSHSYGNEETVLQVPYDCPQDIVINSKLEQKIRIAVLNTTGMRVSELQEYCKMNLITPEYVKCSSVEEQVEAVRDGRADMFLNSSLNYVEGVRTIARFTPRPFYFVTAKGQNSQMMEELNSAILSIEQADPYFATTLYEKYFTSANTELNLSGSEQAYVEDAGILKVGMLHDQPPYQYLREADETPAGIAVDMLDYITEKTGLRFELVPADSSEALYQMVEEGRVDLVAGMSYDYDLAREKGLSMSQPYLSVGYILMMNESISEESLEGKRLALTADSSYKGPTVGNVTRYDTVLDCVKAVADGKADYVYLDVYTAQFYINQPYYRNLKLVAQTYSPKKVCFGVTKPGSRELLSILNKVVATISEVDAQSIVNQNLLHQNSLSLMEFIWQNPVDALLVLSAMFLLIILFLLYILFQRVRMNRRSALELKKHYRVYGLVNEFFYEYNFGTQLLLVSIPPKDETGKPELRPFDCSRPDSGVKDEFLEIILSREDGSRETQIECIDGRPHWLRIALDTVYDGGKPAYALGKINIIDEEKQELDSLLDRASRDSLTQLYNAEASRSLIREGMARLREGEYDGLILVDVDRFKEVNDTYGHLRGDEALQKVAAFLKESVRSDDMVGRPGGDEFCLYLRGIKNARALGEKCGFICERARSYRGEDGLRFTCSVGAVLISAGQEYETVYQRADAATYRAKRLGRDRYVISGEDGACGDGAPPQP